MEDQELNFDNLLIGDCQFDTDTQEPSTFSCFMTKASWPGETQSSSPEDPSSPVHGQNSPKIRKRRTRRLPTRERTKKNEELDKYWLRAFRDYIKKTMSMRKFNLQEKEFWEEYFSEEKTPGKGKEFRSYGKSYKLWLFGHEMFATEFQDWLVTYGRAKLALKRDEDTPVFREYLDYAMEELLTFHTRLCNDQISPSVSPMGSPNTSPCGS